jgi:Molybdopterin converting factor, large subunit
MMNDMISVKIAKKGERIDYGEEIEKAKTSREIGSIVSFLGIVRSEGGRVKRVEQGEKKVKRTLEEIAEEAVEKFGVERAGIIQGVGEMPAGGDIIFITVSSRRREEGFEACEWIIDATKEKVHKGMIEKEDKQ